MSCRDELFCFLQWFSLCPKFGNVSQSVVKIDPEIMSGEPVFVGTRVPVQTLIDYLEGGHSLNAFLDDFPTVTRETAIAALEQAKAHLIADASAA